MCCMYRRRVIEVAEFPARLADRGWPGQAAFHELCDARVEVIAHFRVHVLADVRRRPPPELKDAAHYLGPSTLATAVA